MKRKFTSLFSLALFCAIGAQAQTVQPDLTPFQTLPTEKGKGVVTSLRDNGRWVAFKQAPGYNLGEASWAQFNNPWGGNGKVYLECTGQADDGNYKYIIAGQGLFITGFDTGNPARPVVGPKGKAYEFEAIQFDSVRTDPETLAPILDADGNQQILHITRFQDPITKLYLKADGGNGNNILSLQDNDTNGWEIGTWRGVTFARLDVKPYNGDASGVNIKPCDDGYYYGSLCLPFSIYIPNPNDTNYAALHPNAGKPDVIAAAWKLGGTEDDIQVTPLQPGDEVPGGTPIIVRATAMTADFPYDPTSTYVDAPDKTSFFTGYYTDAPHDDVFLLTLDDGYAKFERRNAYVDPNNKAAGHVGEMRQGAVNLAYILATNNNENIYEYRFNFDENTLTGYENPNYSRILQKTYTPLLTQASDLPFNINPADTAALKAELAGFKDGMSTEDYNAFIEEVNSKVNQPDEFYISLKQNQALGDRGEANRKGLYGNFGTPNGANGRIYFQKVADGQYNIGVNGRWIQAPKPSTEEEQDDGTYKTTTYQVDLGTEPVTFNVNIVAPKQITMSVEDEETGEEIAIATGGNGDTEVNDPTSTNKNGAVIGAPLTVVDDETGDDVYNEVAKWTVNEGTNYTNALQVDAKDASYSFTVNVTDSTTKNVKRNFGTICEPYAITPDLTADASAQLYKVAYDADDNLTMKAVEKLEAGEPGIVSSTVRNTVKVNILNGFVTEPITDEDNALIGILNVTTKPADDAYANPHFLGISTDSVDTGETDSLGNVIKVAQQNLAFVAGATSKYDINKAFVDGGQNANAMPINLEEVVTGIKTIDTKANTDTKRIANDAIYNLAGQRVGKDYKGIVIKNGKKYINK